MRVFCQVDGINQILIHHGKTVASVFRKFHTDSPVRAGHIFRAIHCTAVGKKVPVVKRQVLAIQPEGFSPHLLQHLRCRIVTHHAHRNGPVCPQEQRQRIHFQHFFSSGIPFLAGNGVQHLPASVLPDQQSHMGIHRGLVRSHYGLALQAEPHAENQVALLQQCSVHVCRQRNTGRRPAPGAGDQKKKNEKKKRTGNQPAISTSGRSSTHRSA